MKKITQPPPFYILILLASILNHPLLAQGIKGNVADEKGEPLPFTSIYIQKNGIGTTSNADGYYELKLPRGTYEVSYQFMGYTTHVEEITVAGKGLTPKDIQLQPETFTIKEVTIAEDAEDPAYTIMRKAIAKAKYHLMQCDSYKARVYMKGTGKLDKIPGLFRLAMSDEDEKQADTSRVFTSESVSEISFERPQTFKEHVISIRTSGKDDPNANPNGYLNSSFYQPYVQSCVSPLSPSAFRYYKFEYLGSFADRGYEINKIKVTPRSKGENVYEGEVYIREDFWNIHSLKLKANLGFYDAQVEKIYAPVHSEIWMPVVQKFHFNIKIFGVKAQYKYLASVSNYELVKNGELLGTVSLVDTKIEEAPEKIKEVKKGKVDEGIDKVFKEEKDISARQFIELMEDYEQREKEESGEKDVLSDYSFTVDSLAKTKDSTYWANIRPVPLTQKEKDSYLLDDSVYVAEKEERANDSTRLADGDRFSLWDPLFGGYYKFGKRWAFDFSGFLPHLRFNTVEGLNLDFTGTFRRSNDTTLHITIEPFARYGFSGKRFYGKLKTGFRLGKKHNHNFSLEGGKYISQFKPGSINPFINSLYTLLLERNYMRLYEKDFLQLNYNKDIGDKLELKASAEWAQRRELFNNTGFSIIDRTNKEYFPNRPVNIESAVTGFNNSKAFKTSIALVATPWLKYRKINGRKRAIANSSPKLRFNYNAGWKGISGSTTDYHQLEAGAYKEFAIGVKTKIDLDVTAGSFLSNNNLQFMDYKHFAGGLTEFAPLDVTGNYRLLDYYQYSTAKSYISAMSHIKFRKLLLTQIPLVRFNWN